MEGGHDHPARAGTDELGDALSHLAGGFVGERDGEDLVRTGVAGGEQVRDAAREHPRLARASPGHDQERRATMRHGSSLRRGQSLEQLCGGGNVDGRARSVGHSHSMVPGGLLVTSSATRLTPSTSLISRLAMVSTTS